MEGKKISELERRTLSESEVTQGDIFIPIQSGSSNNRVLISNIYDQINRAVMTQVNNALANFINGGGSGGSTPSSGPTQDEFNSLVNRVSSLERFNDPTFWPTNYIGIKDVNNNNVIYYALPSGPRQSGIAKDEIIIAQSNVKVPDMYFTASINPVTANEGIIVTFTPKTKEGGIDLNGGTVNYLQISGTLRTSSDSRDIEESLPIGGSNGVTFAGGVSTFSPASYQVTKSISDVEGSITNVELKARVGVVINNQIKYVDIPGAVVYYQSGSSMSGQMATGYITLPTSGS